MSRLFAILLSSIIFIQSINIGTEDIMQFDELLEHAQFHNQEYGDNFFVFLSKHYGELKAEHNKTHQEEQKDHEQLPFQCQGHSTTIIALVLNASFLDTDTVETSHTGEFNFYYLGSNSSLHKMGLLEPPKYI